LDARCASDFNRSQWLKGVVYGRTICGEERWLDDPQRPFTRGWLQYANQRSLGRIASMPATQLETFIGDAKISRKQSPADGYETLSEGVAWFDFH
jgi:hypothetical protein